jgi:tetratricopeptide (TPR) repeat protein
MADREIEEVFNKGQRLRQVNQDFMGAIGCYTIVTAKLMGTRDKLYPWACFEKGNAFNALQMFKDAAKAFQAVIDFGPEDNQQYYWAMDKLATMHRKLKSFDKAIEIYENLLTLKPEEGEGWTGKGEVYAAMDKIEDAKTCYKKAIELGETQWAPELLAQFPPE